MAELSLQERLQPSLLDRLTDNHNRTVAEVRHAFSKFGGNLGADGSVSYRKALYSFIRSYHGASIARVVKFSSE